MPLWHIVTREAQRMMVPWLQLPAYPTPPIVGCFWSWNVRKIFCKGVQTWLQKRNISKDLIKISSGLIHQYIRKIQLTFLCQVERLNTPIPPTQPKTWSKWSTHPLLCCLKSHFQDRKNSASRGRIGHQIGLKAEAPTLLAGICLMPPTPNLP